MTTAILWPTFAMVALIFGVWFTLFVRRLGHIRRNPPGRGDFATGESALRYFQPVEMPANNLANLFEMPVLFFALVPLLLVTRHGGTIEVALAWVYVGLRLVHSLIHVGPNDVRQRFPVYIASCAALLAMWLGFAIDIATGR